MPTTVSLLSNMIVYCAGPAKPNTEILSVEPECTIVDGIVTRSVPRKMVDDRSAELRLGKPALSTLTNTSASPLTGVTTTYHCRVGDADVIVAV
jgi:hypothetical protein